MKIEEIEKLLLQPLLAGGGTYSLMQVLHSPNGYYLGRLFRDDDGNEEPGSRESDYFRSRQEATEALMKGFQWRNIAENTAIYERHRQLADAKKKLFSVVEYTSFFAVHHNPSGDEHPMGDGVDTLFDDEGNALIPGTDGFIETWEEMLNATPDETLEAYFPERCEPPGGFVDSMGNAY